MIEVLANRTYRHLFLAQVVALIRTGLATVALGLLAYDLAGKDAGAVLGTALAIKMVTYVFVMVIALPWVDHAGAGHASRAVERRVAAEVRRSQPRNPYGSFPELAADPRSRRPIRVFSTGLAIRRQTPADPAIAAVRLSVDQAPWLIYGTVMPRKTPVFRLRDPATLLALQ